MQTETPLNPDPVLKTTDTASNNSKLKQKKSRHVRKVKF